MARNVRIKWRLAGFREIRQKPRVEADLLARAERIAEACGGESAGYFSASSIGATRARAAVIAGTFRSVRDNAVNQTLLKNLDRGRG